MTPPSALSTPALPPYLLPLLQIALLPASFALSLTDSTLQPLAARSLSSLSGVEVFLVTLLAATRFSGRSHQSPQSGSNPEQKSLFSIRPPPNVRRRSSLPWHPSVFPHVSCKLFRICEFTSSRQSNVLQTLFAQEMLPSLRSIQSRSYDSAVRTCSSACLDRGSSVQGCETHRKKIGRTNEKTDDSCSMSYRE